MVKPIRMSLLENAYDFLNESLRSAGRAEAEPHAWKFAVLNLVQAIELLLKARLQAAQLVEQSLKSSLYRWDCPAPLTLADYHVGRASADQQRAIVRHL